jgi:histidyl-tRNA synthetase
MIQLPNMEFTNLFKKAVGETTDVVSKEMFTFVDKKKRSLSLKPEGTASVVRMVLENKLVELSKEQRFAYFERMYRYERPQKGRQREFIQFGVE